MPFKTQSAASIAPRFPRPQESKGPPDLRGRVEVAPVVTPMRFTLPVPPSVNRLYATAENGMRVKSAEGRAYAVAVAHAFAQKEFASFEGQVGVRIRVYRPRKGGDLDNYSKSLLDSLSGICWIDDRQIVYIESHREDDRNNPRVEIEVWEVPRE